MSEWTPEPREAGDGALKDRSARSGRAVRAGLVLSLAGAVAVSLALAAAPGLARSPSGAQQVRDTIGGEPLRCLTRGTDKCLDEPVPRDEPHKAVCATCHNLWDRSIPPNVTKSCTAAGCHSGASPLSPFPRTVAPAALTDCLHCHQAHEFRVPENGDECAACHKGGGALVEWVSTPSHVLTAPYSRFNHSDHTSVDCARCHGTQEGHGTLSVVSLEDCRSCHHRPPNSLDCTRCHTPESVSAVTLQVTRSLNIRIGSLDRPLRNIAFEHSKHVALGCGECHPQGSDLRAAVGADCSGCHLTHHGPTSDCSRCHQPPAAGAHDLDTHMGCTGPGCHSPAPEGIANAPRTRQLCLACHTEQKQHRPGKVCADCHRLPAATGEGK
ncbi:MAG: hypothetical protein FIA95_03675 [Gemmatimonadetes bacterium]|nr:hypothetical protein [Gemmatimonadota bacterium]